MANVTPRNAISDVATPGPSDQLNFLPRNETLIVFKSNIAEHNDSKSHVCYIDSGATHNFIQNRFVFKTFEEIKAQNFKITDLFSKIIGKRTIKRNLGTTITMEAYYTPDFINSIIATHIISDFFEVHMTSFMYKDNSCLIFKKGSITVNDIVWETKSVNGL